MGTLKRGLVLRALH